MKKLTPLQKYLLGIGRPVDIMIESGREGETADIVVCADFIIGQKLVFPDNEIGQCSKCGCGIQWRPHAPKKPKRCCYRCVPPLPDDGKVMVTAKTAIELGLFYSRKGSKH